MVYDEDPTVPPLAVRVAANRLGVTVWAIHKAIDRGELRPVTRSPLQVSAADVEQMRVRRRDEAIDRIGVDRMARLAADVRAQLHPPFASGAPGGHAALEKLSERVKAAFGMPLLHAAALPAGSGCRWCAAEIAGRMLSVPVRQETLSSQFGIALLGGPECERHRGVARDWMGQLSARVHPGRGRPGDGRTEPVAASTKPPSATPRRAPARPVQDDDGKSMVQRRLRETRARLTAAKRAGDQKYAIRLQQTLQSLTADAAAIDGRASSRGQR